MSTTDPGSPEGPIRREDAQGSPASEPTTGASGASSTSTGRTTPSADGTGGSSSTAEQPTSPLTGAQTGGGAITEKEGGKRTAAVWTALILGAIVLVLLLIFVLQNNVTAEFQYFTATFDLPLGVAMLLAAIAGALLMALVGSVRMLQMSWTIRKLRKSQAAVRRAAGQDERGRR